MSTESTKERLLASGCQVFSEKGFRDATIAEICERADANVAAVNYHYRDKDTLYDACWRHAFAVAFDSYPPSGDLAPGADAADRLRVFIQAFMGRVLDKGEAGYFQHMMVREMAEPTRAIEPILEVVVEPQKALLMSILKDLMGRDADEQRVMACAFSVVSQCVFLAFNHVMRDRYFATEADDGLDQARLSDHIWRFCLAGVQSASAPSEEKT